MNLNPLKRKFLGFLRILGLGKAWPKDTRPEAIFTQVYRDHSWGGDEADFYSGAGSHDGTVLASYVAAVRGWLATIDPGRSMTVVDLGCGDFNVSSQLIDLCGSYVGVDVVRPLIERNQAQFANDRVQFQHLDITLDPLPPGDICLLRQVLQHLSNSQVMAVLDQLERYRWALITESYPLGEVKGPNIDQPPGAVSRSARQSGIFLAESPFLIPGERLALLQEFPYSMRPSLFSLTQREILRTYIVEMPWRR